MGELHRVLETVVKVNSLRQIRYYNTCPTRPQSRNNSGRFCADQSISCSHYCHFEAAYSSP